MTKETIEEKIQRKLKEIRRLRFRLDKKNKEGARLSKIFNTGISANPRPSDAPPLPAMSLPNWMKPEKRKNERKKE